MRDSTLGLAVAAIAGSSKVLAMQCRCSGCIKHAFVLVPQPCGTQVAKGVKQAFLKPCHCINSTSSNPRTVQTSIYQSFKCVSLWFFSSGLGNTSHFKRMPE